MSGSSTVARDKAAKRLRPIFSLRLISTRSNSIRVKKLRNRETLSNLEGKYAAILQAKIKNHLPLSERNTSFCVLLLA